MKAKRNPESGVWRPANQHQPAPVHKPQIAGELLDMEEAIALLKTTRPTFYRWLRAGKLRGTKVGRQWRFLRTDIERFLKGQEPQIDLPADITPLIQILRKRFAELSPAGLSHTEFEAESELAQSVRLMILLAGAMRGSELHIDPQPNGQAALRYRLDGSLQPIAQFDGRLLPAVIKQWRTLASCNVHETARPQEGRILLKQPVSNQELDVRVTFIPAVLGESLTARLLNPRSALIDLDAMAYGKADRKKLESWLSSPWGLIVVTGPAGCGKTSALYACVNRIVSASPTRKVITIEDPVEYLLPGTTQVPVRAEAGLTFSSLLRIILKSPPDVLLVGEIRDAETLGLVLQTALNGHLALTNLHASEAVTALQRMLEVGANPLTVGDATKLIIGQRLVRLLCPKCSVSRRPEEPFLEQAQKLARIGGLAWGSLPVAFREPVGCSECSQTGFRGRNVIAEALEVTPRIRSALSRSAALPDLRAIAVSQGMTTMAAEGLRYAAEGKTSLAEVVKTIGPIYSAELRS